MKCIALRMNIAESRTLLLSFQQPHSEEAAVASEYEDHAQAGQPTAFGIQGSGHTKDLLPATLMMSAQCLVRASCFRGA